MSASDPPDRAWPQADRRGPRDRRQQSGPRTGPGSRGGRPARGAADRRSGSERRDERAWQPVSLDAAAGHLDPRQALLDAAAAARALAQAPYSRFQVGAALETASGSVITGSNVESATYGLTLCAERVALVKALSDGHTAFTRLAVVADTETLTPPCGACRQLLWEYCGDVEVLLGSPRAATASHRLQDLLPLPFDGRLLR